MDSWLHERFKRKQAALRKNYITAQDKAFPAVLEFAEGCVQAGLDVTMTTVQGTITIEDELRCRKIIVKKQLTFQEKGYKLCAE